METIDAKELAELLKEQEAIENELVDLESKKSELRRRQTAIENRLDSVKSTSSWEL